MKHTDGLHKIITSVFGIMKHGDSCLIPVGLSSVESTKADEKYWKKKCVCTENVWTIFFVNVSLYVFHLYV